MAGKAKNAPEAHFPRGNGGRGGGSEARDMTLPSLRNLGAKCSENVIPSFEDLFHANRLLLSLDINLK